MIRKVLIPITSLIFAAGVLMAGNAYASDCVAGPDKDLANCDFSFADLAGKDLSNSNLSGATLESADLTNVTLAGSNLSGSKLAQANLTNLKSGGLTGIPASLPSTWKIVKGYLLGPGANLTDANLSTANLAGVNLASADLTNVKSGGITGTPSSLPTSWKLLSGWLIGPKANLADANLSTSLASFELVNFSGANLEGANLSNKSLVNSNFTSASLKNANLSGAYISSANFTNADLTNANLAKVVSSGSTNMTNANLTGIKSGGITNATTSSLGLVSGWRVSSGYIIGPAADLTDADLTSANLSNLDLSQAILTNVKSKNIFGTPSALPAEWVLLNKHLVGPTANLSGADLTYRDLTGLNLRDVNLTGATLFSSTLNLVDLSTANLTGVNSGGIIGVPSALPSSWNFRNGFLVGPTASFTDRVMDFVDFNGVDLSGAKFTRVRLSSANFTNANLTDATFDGNSLAGVDFSGANLEKTEFKSINIAGTNFSAASMPGLRSSGLYGTPSLPEGWVVANGIMVGPGANLSATNLRTSNLFGVSLEGTDLTGALLENVTSGGVTGKPKSLPSNWTLQNGYLIGPSANVANADLSNTDLRFLGSATSLVITGANFSNANLSGLDLRSMDLRGINFTNSNLSNIRCSFCDFRDATLVGANLSGAILYSANLSGSDARDAKFSSTDLASTNLSNVKLGGADLLGAVLTNVSSGDIIGELNGITSGWRLTQGFLVGPGANLASKNLGTADLSGLDLRGISFGGSDLSQCNLFNITSVDIVGTPTALPQGWKLSRGIFIGPGANLTGIDLNGVSLTNVDLSDAKLDNVRSGNIVGAPVALPTGWKLTRGHLVGPTANLFNANLASANLGGISLANANLDLVASGSIVGVPSELPSDWKLINGYLVGPKANLVGADLSNQNLSGLNLEQTNLTDANLSGVTSGDIIGSPIEVPSGWGLYRGYLVGPAANLQGADFENMTLSGVSLQGTNLSGAKLSGLYAFAITGSPSSLPDGWRIVKGMLVGPRAKLIEVNLRSTNLTGVDLSGADLRGTDLSWSNLSFANLAGADLGDAYLAGTDFSSANLTSSHLYGAYLEHANFTDALAVDAMFATATLSDVKFIRTNLTGSDFYNAVLDLVQSESVVGIPTDLPLDWTVSNGVFLKKLTLLPSQSVSLAVVGQNAKVSLGVFDSQVVPQVQWYLDGVALGGATSQILQVPANYAGRSLSAKVTVTKAGYETVVLKSAGVLVSPGTLKVFSAKVSGLAKINKSVTAVCSGTTLKSTLKYQWLLDGKAIKGATKSKYTITAKQKGHKLSVQVTQTLAGYKTVIKTSTAVKVG